MVRHWSSWAWCFCHDELGLKNCRGSSWTQEMLDFCAKGGITAGIKIIGADEIETAYERMLKSDVKYRFVIDIATMDQ